MPGEMKPTLRTSAVTCKESSRAAVRWYTLAASQGDDLADKFKDHLEKAMTLDELAEAQQMAREWTPKGE